MKKITALLLAAIMMLALFAGCGTTEETAEEPVVEETTTTVEETTAAEETEEATETEEAAAEITTVVPGTLTVATSPDFAPYEFYAIDENGDPVMAGFDPALAQYIADYLGLELEIIPMDFDGVLAELAAGSIDLGMAGLSPDPDREDAMDFSDIYYEGGQSFVCVAGNEELFTTLADANNADYTIAAQNGSIQYDLAMENTPDADVLALTKVTDIIAELLAGTIDGAFIETAVAESYAKNYPDLVVKFDVAYDVEGSSVGVVKGNEALLAGVNEAIAAALADGSMDEFVATANSMAEGNVYEGLLENFEG